VGSAPTYVDTLRLVGGLVGYGVVGRGGSLGYEGKEVRVLGRRYQRALSTHPTSRLVFELDGRPGHFACQVALNDDVPTGASEADFTVLLDGREMAVARRVLAGDPPFSLRVPVAGATRLELAVRTGRWEFSHAVWLDPCLEASDDSELLTDCLGRTVIEMPRSMLRATRCIATVASSGFARHVDDLFGSLIANGNCPEALLVLFAVDPDPECLRVAEKYGAFVVRCRPHAPVNATVKALMYSIARIVEADQFICLDADMLVLGDLRPVFSAIEASPPGSILAVREGNHRQWRSLGHILCGVYGGRLGDITRLLRKPAGEETYSLVVNDGLFAGGRTGLLALDTAIRAMTEAPAWVDEHNDIWWRNQLVFNLALARMECGVELDATYNVQLNFQDVPIRLEGARIRSEWEGRPVRVVHFNGLGRNKYAQVRDRYARVLDPMVGRGDPDHYGAFLGALRAWVGRHGLSVLAWSFYGTSDARSARVHDVATMPLLGLLHYVVRANGCIRVVETGTGRGVSTACLASAVVSRPGGRVVTFDSQPREERLDLWGTLPAPIKACIEERVTDSVGGMTAALEAGESYEAALLDSLHTEEHVWAEFQLATQLVCPGGLILVHDACYVHGTVGAALDRIAGAGYGVVRLWAAAGGIPEDDQLGLAVIENRRQQVPYALPGIAVRDRQFLAHDLT
jgi:predicted O-methyltransferase YrrM